MSSAVKTTKGDVVPVEATRVFAVSHYLDSQPSKTTTFKSRMPVSRGACKAVKGLISYHVLFTGQHIHDTDEIDNPYEKMPEPPAASCCCDVEELSSALLLRRRRICH
jgi:hypothetical protein